MYTAIAALALALPAVQAMAIEKRATITDFSTSPLGWAYPRGRAGFTAGSATTAPCGGMAPSSNRTQFPLSGGEISLVQMTELEGVNILYVQDPNPERFHSFLTYTNSITKIGSGHFCTAAPNFANAGLKAGDDVTMLAIYQLSGQDTYYYQCADITLTEASSYTAPDYVCGNYTRTLEIAGQDQSYTSGGSSETAGFGGETGSTGGKNPHTDGTIGYDGTSTTDNNGQATGSSASSNSNSGLSAAAGGGIGAAAAVVVLLAALAVAKFTGFVRFGKKQDRVTRDDVSEASSAPPMKAVA